MQLHDRLDVFIKVLYIKGYIEGENFIYYQDLYRKHIALFNGSMEDNKTSLDDFESSFQGLINNIKSSGYNENYPILINKEKQLINGAHRLACCLYFSIDPIFKTQDEGYITSWGLSWFTKNNFSQEEILYVLQAYASYEKDISLAVLWPPIHAYQENTRRIFREHNIDVGCIYDINLNAYTFSEIVYDIYAFDNQIQVQKVGIDSKIIEMTSHNTNISIALIYNPDIKKKKKKEDIRKKMMNKQDIKPSNKYLTFHRGDTLEEEQYLKNILVNPNNVHHLHMRNYKVHDRFIRLLEDLSAFLDENNISQSEYCIVGSGPLGVFGIDKVSDIDIIMDNVKNSGISKHGSIDILDYNYHKDIPNNEIVSNPLYHFYWRGYKFISLSLLEEVKSIGSRMKDIQQAEKIDTFIANKNKSHTHSQRKIHIHSLYIRKKIVVLFFSYSIKLSKKLGIYALLSYLRRKYILKNLK